MSKLILIVDDDPKNVKLLKDVLDVAGFDTLVAVNGKEAVDLAIARKPNMILMDIQMPVMNGIDATRLIRKEPELAKVPIYAVTASVMSEQCKVARQAGVDDVISKPIDIRAVLARMRAELGA